MLVSTCVFNPLFYVSFVRITLTEGLTQTAGLMGALSYVGATAKSDQYLYMGGPLLGGLVVVALSSLAPMVLPRTAMRTLAVTEAVSLYGGLVGIHSLHSYLKG